MATHSVKLPAPPPELAAMSEELRAIIAAEIAASGPVSFARFMDLALYHPRLGYYRNGLMRFGPEGDFVTAPELGGLFGQALARQIDAAQKTDAWCLMEIGAGSGVLAREVLTALDRPPDQYFILETSGELRDRQQQTLAALPKSLVTRVHWLDAPPEQSFNGIIVANEVLDALPVQRFETTAHDTVELLVGTDDQGRFAWRRDRPDRHLADALPTLPPLPTGYRSEVCTLLPEWLKTVTEPLATGLVFFIDYGYPASEYYLPERSDGTLVCHYRHRAHFDPFIWPGLTDISAFVDFSAVKEAAEKCGLNLAGFTTQAHFLLNLGTAEAIAEASDDVERLRLAQQLRRLTLPGEMGEKFKVMALSRGATPELQGFAFGDQSHRL